MCICIYYTYNINTHMLEFDLWIVPRKGHKRNVVTTGKIIHITQVNHNTPTRDVIF